MYNRKPCPLPWKPGEFHGSPWQTPRKTAEVPRSLPRNSTKSKKMRIRWGKNHPTLNLMLMLRSNYTPTTKSSTTSDSDRCRCTDKTLRGGVRGVSGETSVCCCCRCCCCCCSCPVPTPTTPTPSSTTSGKDCRCPRCCYIDDACGGCVRGVSGEPPFLADAAAASLFRPNHHIVIASVRFPNSACSPLGRLQPFPQ